MNENKKEKLRPTASIVELKDSNSRIIATCFFYKEEPWYLRVSNFIFLWKQVSKLCKK